MILVVRPAAAAELEDAFNWYEAQRTGLGEELLSSVESVFSAILERPTAYPILHRGIRRARVRRFPYAVLYRLLEDRLVVVAIFHGRRDPRRWQQRR